MNEKGFISSAALSLVLIGVVVSFFSFLFVLNDVHSASQTGFVVEMTKWHGDLVDYNCKKDMDPNPVFKTAVMKKGVGPELSRNGNETTLRFTGNELMNIEVSLVENYAPTVLLTEDDGDELDGNVTFTVTVCDPEGLREEDMNYSLFRNDTLMNEERLYGAGGVYDDSYEVNVTEEFKSDDVYEFKANVSDRDKFGEDIIVRTIE